MAVRVLSPLLLLLLGCLRVLPQAEVRILRVGVIQSEGFCTPKTVSSNGTPSAAASNWEGFVPDVVRELGKLMEFVPNFYPVSDGRYGVYDDNTKTWNGLMGEVVRHSIDFGAAPLTVNALREDHVDFTHELLDIGLVVLIKRPERLSPALRGSAFFLSVFDSGVWGSVVAAFVVTSFLLHLNDRYNPREARAKMAEHIAANTVSASPLNQFSLLGSAFYVISTGCFQGYQRAPRSLCGRCLSLCWWVFACILAATYTAGFLCALVASGSGQDNTFAYMDARDQYQMNPDTMQAVTPLWLSGGSTDRMMRNSTDPLFQFFLRQHEQAAKDNPRLSDLRNMSEVVELLKTGHHYLWIVESPYGDFYARKSRCEVIVAGNLISDRSYAFAFPENSSALLGRMNEAILQLRESGFIRHTYQRHLGGPLVPCGQANPSLASAALGLAGEELARMFRDSLPITLKTFAGPVVLYFLSLLVSALAALIDVHIFANIERQQNPPQVLRSTQEPADDPNFSSLAYSDEQRLRQEQQRQEEAQRQQPDDPQLIDG